MSGDNEPVDWRRFREFGDVDLSGATMPGCSVLSANLTGARLRGADLRKANFIECTLDGADFAEAKLDQATFVACHGKDVSFREADFGGLGTRGLFAGSGVTSG